MKKSKICLFIYILLSCTPLCAHASCLKFSTDGATVTGTDGTCTAVRASDFGSAVRIADGSFEAGVFSSSRDTLASVEFPEGLLSVGSFAFYGCGGLSGDLVIPDSVTSIGAYAFAECPSLSGSLSLGSGLTTVGRNAFFNDAGLSGTLDLPASLAVIGTWAFGNCSGFESGTVLPPSVETGEYAFYGCTAVGGFADCLPWYLPEGVAEEDVVAAYRFSGQEDLSGSLVNVNEGTKYVLSVNGKDAGLLTYDADKGVFIPATSANGNGGTGLVSTALNARAGEIVSSFVRYSDYYPSVHTAGRAALLSSYGSFDQMLFAGIGYWDSCADGHYIDIGFNRYNSGYPGIRVHTDKTSSDRKMGYVYYSEAEKNSGVLGRIRDTFVNEGQLYPVSGMSKYNSITAQTPSSTSSDKGYFRGETGNPVTFGNGMYSPNGCYKGDCRNLTGGRYAKFDSYYLTASAAYSIPLTASQAREITENMYTFPDGVCTVDITVRKEWVSDGEHTEYRPESVTLDLLADGEKYDELSLSGEGSVWNASVTDLPKYNSDFSAVRWTVSEHDVPNYSVSYSQDGLSLTNTLEAYTCESEDVCRDPLTMEKAWRDEGHEEYRPESVYFRILADGEALPGEYEVSAQADDVWEHPVIGIFPKKTVDGETILYEAEEIDPPVQYAASADGMRITNSLILLENGIRVEKIWQDDGDRDGKRPGIVTVRLLAGDAECGSVVLPVGGAEGQWLYEFLDLPKYDLNGDEIEYTVIEE